MKTLKLLLIVGLLFTIAADDVTPESPPEETPELVEEIPPEITEEPEPEITPEPTGEVIPEIPPEPEIAIITGCTDSQAANYIPPGEGYVVKGDSSCIYFEGCMDKRAMNYADMAVRDNGSCMYLTGCTDKNAVNYVDYSAYGLYLYADDGSCVYPEGYEGPQPEEPEEVEPVDIFFIPDEIIADCLTTDGERICL